MLLHLRLLDSVWSPSGHMAGYWHQNKNSSVHLTNWIQQNRTRTARPTGFANTTQIPQKGLSSSKDSPLNHSYMRSVIQLLKLLRQHILSCHLATKIERKKESSAVDLADFKRHCTVLHVVYTDLDLDMVNTSRDSLSIASSTSLLMTSSSIPQLSPSEHKHCITLCVLTWNITKILGFWE